VRGGGQFCATKGACVNKGLGQNCATEGA